MRPARPGDNIGDFFTTRVFNRLVKGTTLSASKPNQRPVHIPTTIIGNPTTDIPIYHPVGIDGPALTNSKPNDVEDNEYYNFPTCNVATTFTDHNWAVAQTYLRADQPGLCVVMGLTWVYADITDLEHRWLKASGTGLVSSEYKGKARIITPPQSTGLGYCLAYLGMMPSELQTVVTALQVSPTSVQYKTRNIYGFFDNDETDWINLASVVCPEVP